MSFAFSCEFGSLSINIGELLASSYMASGLLHIRACFFIPGIFFVEFSGVRIALPITMTGWQSSFYATSCMSPVGVSIVSDCPPFIGLEWTISSFFL